MISIEYKNKEGNKRVLTYPSIEDYDVIGYDLKQIIEQGATNIKIN